MDKYIFAFIDLLPCVPYNVLASVFQARVEN